MANHLPRKKIHLISRCYVYHGIGMGWRDCVFEFPPHCFGTVVAGFYKNPTTNPQMSSQHVARIHPNSMVISPCHPPNQIVISWYRDIVISYLQCQKNCWVSRVSLLPRRICLLLHPRFSSGKLPSARAVAWKFRIKVVGPKVGENTSIEIKLAISMRKINDIEWSSMRFGARYFRTKLRKCFAFGKCAHESYSE